MHPSGPFLRALLASIIAGCLSCGDSLDVPEEAHNLPGTLEISIATSGVEPDPDGYFVRIDDETPRPVEREQKFSLAVSPGTHRVELSGVAPNCAVEGDNPQSLTTAADETAAVGFGITCASLLSAIQVTVETVGDSPDSDGYQMALDDGELLAVGASDRHDFSGVRVGAWHVVELSGIAPNCRVRGTDRVQVWLAVAPATVSFKIECFSAGIPGWDALALPSGLRPVGVWASSATDLFVPAADSAANQPVILHYDGKRWAEQYRGTRGGLSSIWGSSPTDVFVAGTQGLLLHYGGRQWSQFPIGFNESRSAGVLWGSSPTDVFVGGGLEDVNIKPMVQHYDGGQWRDLDGRGVEDLGEFTDISGTSPTDVYFVGWEASWGVEPEDGGYTTWVILHYDGAGWATSFESTYSPTEEYYALRGVWANAPNDVFTVGSRGRILHYDGSTWSPMASRTPGQLKDVWGRSSDDVYAVGEAGILHYDGASWSVLSERPACSAHGLAQGNCIWGTATDVFVMNGAVILHGTSAGGLSRGGI